MTTKVHCVLVISVSRSWSRAGQCESTVPSGGRASGQSSLTQRSLFRSRKEWVQWWRVQPWGPWEGFGAGSSPVEEGRGSSAHLWVSPGVVWAAGQSPAHSQGTACVSINHHHIILTLPENWCRIFPLKSSPGLRIPLCTLEFVSLSTPLERCLGDF